MSDKNYNEFESVEELLNSLSEDFKSYNRDGGVSYSFINPNKVKYILGVYSELQKIIEGKNIRIEYELCEPTPNFGSIGITGSSIKIKDIKAFTKIAEEVANFEIIPKTDGTMEMNFGFYGLNDPLE